MTIIARKEMFLDAFFDTRDCKPWNRFQGQVSILADRHNPDFVWL
jgi:hypothetical protein